MGHQGTALCVQNTHIPHNHRLQHTVRCYQTQTQLFYTYLVDPASGHMLVSKLKPCMSKYRPNLQTVKLQTAHKSDITYWALHLS